LTVVTVVVFSQSGAFFGTQVVVDEVALGLAALAEQQLAGTREPDLAPIELKHGLVLADHDPTVPIRTCERGGSGPRLTPSTDRSRGCDYPSSRRRLSTYVTSHDRLRRRESPFRGLHSLP
jgi:hypothetical protein